MAILHAILSTLLVLLQVLFFSAIFYAILRLLRNTPGIYGFATITAFLAVLSVVSYLANMPEITRFSRYAMKGMPICVLVLFHSEVRRWLINFSSILNSKKLRLLWRKKIRHRAGEDSTINETIAEIVNAVCAMSARKEWRETLRDLNKDDHLLPVHTGALIAITGKQGLQTYAQQGEEFNCDVSYLVLRTIFHKGTPLHDGGVIIQDNRIIAAGCLFPPSTKSILEPTHTRHNAALGLAETTDALVIAVSEETGLVSIAENSRVIRVESPKALEKHLQEFYGISQSDPKGKMRGEFWKNLSSTLSAAATPSQEED